MYSRRRSDLVGDPDEKKKHLSTTIGAVYERELTGRGEVAIDTYQRVLELDPVDRAGARRGSMSSIRWQSENWVELLSVLSAARRSSTSDPMRGDQLPVSDRGALREAPRRHAARHRALPRDPARADARSRVRPSPRSRGIKNGTEVDRPGRRSPCWSRSTTRCPASGRSLVSVLEVQVRARGRSVPEAWSSSTGSPASTRTMLGGSHERRSSTYARAVAVESAEAGVGNEQTRCSNLERLALGDRPLGGRRARSTTRQLDKLDREPPERFIDLGLRLANIFEDAARGRRERDRTATGKRRSRSTPRTRAADARARPPLHP